MGRRFATGVAVAVVALGVGSVLATSQVWIAAFVAGLAGVGLWQLSRCHHPRPLALLPPIVERDGVQVPARWFCAGCGREWPTFLERPRPPIQIFKGHDESKAREAARRAAAFEGRLRELAVQRAGMKKPALPARRTVPAPVSLHVHRALSDARNRLTS